MYNPAEYKSLLDSAEPQKSRWRGYWELMRLHKPVMGNTLMFWPCAWGLTMAAYTHSIPPREVAVQTAMFAMGSTLMHSAACVLNDICDIDFDRKVERCRTRPLPAGIVSISEAWVLLVLLTIPAVGMLLLTNHMAALCGLLGVFPLHTLYPLMKRWTYWPQAWLGLAMNWGFPVAWLSITGGALSALDARVLVGFFLGTVCWTIVYDTIYACQDLPDDIAAGIKSTAVLFGSYVRQLLSLFTVLFLSLLLFSGYANGQGWGYYAISCGGAAGFFVWQFARWDPDVPEDGGKKFVSNGAVGVVIYAGVMVDYLVRVKGWGVSM